MTQTAVTQFNPEQLALVKNTVAKNTTDPEFRLFIEVCKYHGLNPFARQIYAVVRTGERSGRQMTIQTSIDGYRLLAERSGKYAGQTGPEWCGEDGIWKDVWLSDKAPSAARIGVLRKDFSQPTWGIAKYKSYAQTSPLWTKMPDVMLAKCAESLALRKAFPAEMSGIYTKEEMEQADDDLPTVAVNGTTVESEPVQQTVNPANPAPGQDISKALATEQQISSMHKLYEHLCQSVPEDVVGMTYLEAQRRIQQLTAEYRTAKQNGTLPAPGTTYLKPSEVDALKAEWVRICDIKGDDLERRWKSFKVYLTNGTSLGDHQITREYAKKAQEYLDKQSVKVS
jgi:phage recombination protein Bet